MRSIRFLYIYLIMALYVLLEMIISKYFPTVFSLFLHPIFLIGISILLYFVTENNHGRFPKNKEYIKKIIIIMLIYVILYYFSGFIFGFLKSPYSHTVFSIVKNSWQSIAPIICIEFIRSLMINNNKTNKFAIVLFTLLIFLVDLNLNTFIDSFNLGEEGFKYISSTVVPLIATELICSYLVTKGSYKLSMPYRFILDLIIIISPVFPDLNWFVEGIVGIVFPMIIFIFYKYDFDRKRRDLSRRDLKKSKPIFYVPIVIVIIIFACFMLGFFKYEPIAVVSNSMHPTFNRGDVVILCKVPKKDLKKLDIYTIIVYSMENQLIVHRVIEKNEKNDEVIFKTQGDANLTPDSKPVEEKQVVGKYVFSIKYIGYPSVWLNDFFKKQKPKVEIK